LNTIGWFSLLKKLADTDGTSGCEENVRSAMSEEMRRFCKQVTVDPFGNLVAEKKGRSSQSKMIMLVSHMDEVGLVIKDIRSDGYLSFEMSGFVDPSILPSQWVRISTGRGLVRGIIGTRAGHFAGAQASPISHRSLLVDVGARSRVEAEDLGVKVGDFATYDRTLNSFNNDRYVVGKALDNRIGCTVMIETMRQLATDREAVDCRVYGVGTVMEEIGAVGARVAANSLRPDFAIVLDGLPGSDPYVPPEQSAVQIGRGPVIRKAELRIPETSVTPKWLLDLATGVAEEKGIPYQVDVASAYFSDASSVAASGVPVLPILIARQNSHSPAEIASVDDIERSIELTVAIVKKLTHMSSSKSPKRS
jgi:endoglucanase